MAEGCTSAELLRMRRNRRAGPKRKETVTSHVATTTIYFVVVRTKSGDRCPAMACFNGPVCGFTDLAEAERDLEDIRKSGAEAFIVTDDALTGAVIKAFDKAKGLANG